MQSFESLEDFDRNHPSYGVNLARMRNDAAPEKATLFVEGDDDRKFYRALLKDASRWTIVVAHKKQGVMERYRRFLKNPVEVPYAYFCADLDFDYALELFSGKGKSGAPERLVKADNFFYQLFDIAARDGYSDMESFLFMSEAYRSLMVEIYDDDEVIDSIRNRILDMAVVLGAFRIANVWVCEEMKVPQGVSILCNRSRERADLEREKFDVTFMDSFGLVDFRNMTCSSIEDIGVVLTAIFGEEEFGGFLPQVIEKAKDIYHAARRKPQMRRYLMRGHDLTELLACKLVYDKKLTIDMGKGPARSINEKLRDALESDLRKAAGGALAEIKKFPLGTILR